MTQRYDTYKDSGVQWLGEIPGHWGCVAIGRVTNVILGKMLQNEPKGNTDTLTPYLCAKDVHFDGVDVSDLKQMYFSDTDLIHYAVQQGDMLIVEGGAGAGNCAILHQTTSTIGIQNSIMIVRGGEKIDNSYTCYFLSNIVQKGYVDFITNVATIPHFTKEKVCRTSMPLPPLPEQHAIVSYLNDKCGKIDEWIEKKQKEVELLGEMKQRVIADAVTRGLNPNVKMKTTNIPWLPEVPEHWECIKMKYLFNERSEKNHPDEVSLCATQTYGVIPQKLYCSYGNRVVEVSKGFELLKFVKEGDFVIHLRSFQGGIEYAYYQGIISPAYTILEPKDANNSPYLKFLFKSYNFIQLLKTCVTGIREGQNINYSMLGNKYLFVPPLSEQRAIVSYITERTAKIDKMVENVNKEIEALKEYKQRLISDVVTGQIKVC